MSKDLNRWPLSAIRQNCLDCSGARKAVLWCPCDGAHSARCHLWPFRFGVRPNTFAKNHCPELLIPEAMPGADIPEDSLPSTLAEAVEWFRQRRQAKAA